MLCCCATDIIGVCPPRVETLLCSGHIGSDIMLEHLDVLAKMYLILLEKTHIDRVSCVGEQHAEG